MAVSTPIRKRTLTVTLIRNDLLVHQKKGYSVRQKKGKFCPPRLQVRQVGRDLSCCSIMFLTPLDIVLLKATSIMTLYRTHAKVTRVTDFHY